jgi:hypothetical protein
VPDTLLLTALGALAGVIGVLWRQLLVERQAHVEDRRVDSRLIFALLGERARSRSERPPPTLSTPEKPIAVEARALATQALNGDVEALIQEYLDGPPTKDETKRRRNP